MFGGVNRVKGSNQERVRGHQGAASDTPSLYFAAVFFFKKNKQKQLMMGSAVSPQTTATTSHEPNALIHITKLDYCMQ